MSENKRVLPPIPPLDLKEAEEWLLRLEDIATTERDIGEASRHILANLLLALHRTKVINAVSFLEWLRGGIPHIEEANYRCATEMMTELLLAQIRTQETSETSHIHGKFVH